MAEFVDTEEFFTALRALIDAWCDRRCLKALSLTLDAYLGFDGLTDSWGALNASLCAVRARADGELLPAERDRVRDLIAASERIVWRS